jgi:hypothetical protein
MRERIVSAIRCLRARSLQLVSALACITLAGACQENLDLQARKQMARTVALAAAANPTHAPVPTMRVGDETVTVANWNSATAAVSKVASFEMSCPPDQLQFTLLKSAPYATNRWPPWGAPTQLGVTGCAQRRVYTRFDGGTVWSWASSAPASTDAR